MKKLTQAEVLKDAKQFVEFMNVDIAKAELSEKMKWTTFCLDIMYQTDDLERRLSEWNAQDKLKSCQTVLLDAFSKMMKRENVSILHREDIKLNLMVGGDVNDVDNWRMYVIYEAPTDEQTFLLYFFKAIEYVPVDAYRACEHCGDYFLHLSKKIRLYCCNICAVKHQSVLRKSN